MPEKHLDLRDEIPEKEGMKIPKNGAIAVTAILVVSGIMIGLLLPEFLSEKPVEKDEDFKTTLSVILSSTIDEIETERSTYTDITIPQAYYALLKDGSDNMSASDDRVSEYMDFILDEGSGFELKISSGIGWNNEVSHVFGDGERASSSSSTEQEVVVDIKDGIQITMRFELTIWEGNSV